MLKNSLSKSKEEKDTIFKKVEEAHSIKHENIARLVGYNVIDSNEMCGEFHNI